MNLRRRRHLARVGLALSLALSLAAGPASAETCTADSFGDAVDASAAELRAFSAEIQPKLRTKLDALRSSKGWADPDYETKGLKLVHDAKLDEFDSEASTLLSRIDTLGSPDATDSVANTSCASLSELKAASSELMAVMRAKSAYLISKIDREIEKSPSPAAAPTEVAKAEPERTVPPPAADPTKTEPAKTEPAAEPMPDLSPIRRSDPPKAPPAAAATPAPTPTPPPPAAVPAPQAAPPKEAAAPPPNGSESSSTWSTTTAEAVIPPPPAYDTPPPGTPYELPPVGEDGQIPDGETTFDDQGGGYTIDEIRETTRGFFGTISTSLASVIEHAFQKSGRPTAYVLGNEGGGAFLAGLRYGEGTLYLRNGGSQKVYWHGPSIGYDLGAEGSRTLFLIYDLHEPNTIFRRFTGVDGSAYLVGGVGMTLLKGGEVTMAPIRSGLGLRLGASIGYVRFASRPTWNPF